MTSKSLQLTKDLPNEYDLLMRDQNTRNYTNLYYPTLRGNWPDKSLQFTQDFPLIYMINN